MSDLTPLEKFNQLMRTDTAFRAEAESIGASAFYSVAREAVRRGEIDITGRSAAEAMELLCAYVKGWAEAATDIAIVTDHRSEILTEARHAATNNRMVIAIILYATYFEHELNDLVLAVCARARLPQTVALRLLRTSSISDKTGDLLGELDFALLPTATAKTIRRIADLRNELVHYKWIARYEDEAASNKKRMVEAIRLAESAIEELESYQNNTLLSDFDKLFDIK